MLCGPWLDPEGIDCGDEPIDPGKLEGALRVATGLLWRATAMRYSGVCTDVVRPCASTGPGVQMLSYSTGGARPINVMAGCGCAGDRMGCGCTAHPNIRLPGRPVIDVPLVLIDGAPFTEFQIVDDRWLVRADGGSWPCCQNLALPETELGTFEVTYRYGRAVPEPLLEAARVLTCELVAGQCEGDDCPDCVLPKRLTSLNYEGATMTVLDPFQFLDDGRFGIAVVDYAVRQFNPAGLDRPGTVVGARDYLSQTRRVRPG